MKKIFSINVCGKNGYSFAVECDCFYDEESVIDAALENGLFDEEIDADYAVAEDITEYEDDIKALRNCTSEI